MAIASAKDCLCSSYEMSAHGNGINFCYWVQMVSKNVLKILFCKAAEISRRFFPRKNSIQALPASASYRVCEAWQKKKNTKFSPSIVVS